MRCPARPAWFGNPVRLWCRAGPRSIGECGISVMYVGANWRYVAGRGDRIAAARQDTIVEGLPGDGEPLPLPIDKLEGVARPRPCLQFGLERAARRRYPVDEGVTIAAVTVTVGRDKYRDPSDEVPGLPCRG